MAAKLQPRPKAKANVVVRIHLQVTAAQAKAVNKGGTGTTIIHPRSATKLGRRSLATALTNAGVPAGLVKTLGWRAGVDHPKKKPAAKKAAVKKKKSDKKKPAAND